MRPPAKVLGALCVALVSLAWGPRARPAAEPVPAKLRQLAARAARRDAWPRLRRYAESQKDRERRSLAYFALGYREFEAKEFSAATGDLRQAAERGFFLADYAAYHQAAAARQANDLLQAAAALEDFSARFPESFLRVQALALRAEALIDAHQPARAVQALTAQPSVHQRPLLALLLGRAYFEAGQFAEAARAFQGVYFAFPTAPQAKDAAESLDALRSRLGANFPLPAEEIETARVEILFKASRFEAALKEYTDLLETRPASPLAGRWQLGRARCLIRLRRTGEALQALAPGFEANPAMEAERLALLVETCAQQGDATATLQALSRIQSLDAQSPSYASALFSAGSLFYRQSDWTNAARYYQPLVESFAEGEHARDASWRLAWCYYLARDHDRAHQALMDHLSRYPDSPHVAAALYWLGRLAEERGAISDARALYRLLPRRFPRGYYALQAGQRAQKLPADQAAAGESRGPQPSSPIAKLAQSIPPPELPPGLPCAPGAPGEVLRPVLILRGLSLDNLAEDYLKAGLSERPASLELRLALSRLEAEQGNASAALFDAIKLAPAYSEVEFAALPKELWNLLYPQAYWKLIERQARANRLDPYLVMGLIRQESAFNPRATSRANARGLMQVLPQTASRSRRRARLLAAARRLYDPAYNVRVGCAYLRDMLKTFNGNLEQALAAYNAGDFRVKDWLDKYPFREPAEFVETIPIRDTRAYVQTVLRDAAIYRQLVTGKPKFKKCS